ncbi:hypothetical protein ACQQ2N_00395 [Dokdonella sp. MW10]|uniref:hypothetical protein n=1 Tax=Dokdonella sp. MW10 TaxID=2992926 RepID=UPI003F808DF3
MSGLYVLLWVIPAALFVLVHAAFAKLAALLFGRARLAWRHAFAYAGLLLLVSMLVGAGMAWLAPHVPEIVASALGLALCVLLGGGFFRGRVTDARGVAFGWSRALLLTLVAFVLAVLTGLALMLLFVPLASVP